MNIQKCLDLFEYVKDEKSDNPRIKEGFWCFKSTVIAPDNKGYVALSEVIRESDLDEDSAYKFTVEALNAIKELDTVTGELLEDAEAISQYSEAPIYNSELTDWIGKGTNYSLVDDVMREIGEIPEGGLIQLIQLAYSRAWEEHYYKVLEVVK